MLRCILVLAGLLMGQNFALAGPKEDAAAVLERFLLAFTSADIDGVTSTFWPDALLWGNTSAVLATNAEEVRGYFKPVATRQPNEMKATSLPTSSVIVSDSVVLISGLWQIERVVDGKLVVTVSRLSAVVTKRGDEWRTAQFHSSVRPSR